MSNAFKENSNDNVFLITETAVLRKSNPENGLGIYYIIAKTADGLLHEHKQTETTIEPTIMWADMLKGTILQSENWYPLIKVL